MGLNALMAAMLCMTGPETNKKPTEEVVGRAKYTANGTKDPEVAIESDKSALVAEEKAWTHCPLTESLCIAENASSSFLVVVCCCWLFLSRE